MRRDTVRAVTIAVVLLLHAARPASAIDRAGRACDGSAIVDVGDDYFLNATDEDNVIRLYKRGTVDPIREFDLTKFLDTEKNKRGFPKEADIEAVARLGTRLYWIGSHGRDSKGNPETSRQRLFCTTQNGRGGETKLEPLGRPFTGLMRSFDKLDPTISSALRAAEPAAPKSGGINIEGLGAAGNDSLLIGFRSPLVESKALILRLLNPAATVEQGADAALAEPVLLDLGGLGIRAIEPKSDKEPTSYWILAGSSRDGDETRLYEWDVGAKPKAVTGIALAKQDGNAEGLAFDASSGQLLISMDGGEIGATPCKDRPIDKRSFAVQSVAVGATR